MNYNLFMLAAIAAAAVHRNAFKTSKLGEEPTLAAAAAAPPASCCKRVVIGSWNEICSS